ncbi:diguanylate cyclase domain-containing protein [Amphibacillus sp. Q70]|uniref:sensor domain-containing protein n=1 Tax=Amphibacillus sp. Q70 TaxID=3453416 RepID=UPI003F87160C
MSITNQEIIDGIQDMVFVVRVSEDGSQFCYQLINRAVREKLLLTDEIIGKEIRQVNPEQLAVSLVEKYQQAVKQKSTYVYQDDYLISFARQRISETTLTPIIEAGKVTHLIAITRDITEQKKVEAQKLVSNQRLKFSRQRYKSLFDENTDPIAYLNVSGKIIRMNKASQLLLQQLYQSNQDRNIFDLIKTNDEDLVIRAFQETKLGQPQSVEITVMSEDQYEVRLQIKFIPMLLEREVQGVYLIFKDMTAERFAKDALLKSEERFRLIAEHSSDLIQILDQYGHFVYTSPSHEHVLGLKLADFENRKLIDLVDQRYHNRVQNYLKYAVRDRETKKVEVKFRNSSGDYRWFELKIEPVFDQQSIYQHTIVVARDIEERKLYEKKLRRLAYRDPLTGLANRRLFNDRLHQTIAKYKRYDQLFAVIILDLDDFKGINDQFGHDAGDQVIIQISQRLRKSVREMDTVSRLGGDEFIILLPDIGNKDNLKVFIQRVEKVLKLPYQVNNTSLFVGVSLGAVIPDKGNIHNKAIISQADKALYEAKRSGKNRAIIL